MTFAGTLSSILAFGFCIVAVFTLLVLDPEVMETPASGFAVIVPLVVFLFVHMVIAIVFR
jgi:hypothetical protein